MSNIENTFSDTRALPVIPLQGTVAFPHMNFRIDSISGSALYAFAEAVGDDSDVLLLTQKNLLQDDPSENDFFDIGVIAKIKKVVQNPDLTRSVIFEGVSRATVTSLTSNDNFFTCDAQELAETPLTEEQAAHNDTMILRELLRELEKYNQEAAHNAYLAAVSMDDIGRLCDYVAANILNDYRRKQKILESANHLTRLHTLIEVLGEELEQMRCDAQIESTVRESIEENHRDYYLREQLKAIQNELGVEEDDEIKEYADKIAAANLPEAVSEKLNKELGRLAKTPFGAAESTVLRNYLDICLDIPWSKRNEEAVTVAEAKQVLEHDHDGLKAVKDRILEYIAVQQIAPGLGGQILCLVGPPGVGKTSIAISIAHAMKRSYARISLGGIRDEADIRGHRKTYVGAMPGRIVDALTDAKVMNPVIILDEIDKLSSSQMGDPASALLEVLDPEQNKSFRDHFTEIPMDLSGCLFIATANYYEGIPAPLLDRMEIIELPSYTEREKYKIALHHLVPKQLHNHGLVPSQLHFTESGIYEIIRHYTKEAGVRELERRIAAVCRKAARKIAEGSAKSATFSQSNASSYLGNRKFLDEELSPVDPIGIVNGLAYTTAGGDLLKVEVLVMNGTGKIELTGSLGDVMKESAHIAISYVRSIADQLSLPTDFYKTKDMHIHFPEGAIPKDGPSAGVAMTCAIVSALTGLPARRDVAMTGEVTLHGAVLPIGGLKEKTMAAYRTGIKTVLIPSKNAPDLDTLDPEVKKHLCFIQCDSVEDALKQVIVTNDKPLCRTTPVRRSAHSSASSAANNISGTVC
jgi:ATP-dependent Lon protease